MIAFVRWFSSENGKEMLGTNLGISLKDIRFMFTGCFDIDSVFVCVQIQSITGW